MEQRAEWRSWSRRTKSKGVNDAAGLKIIIHPSSKMDGMLDGREAMNWSTGSANMAHRREQCQWGWKRRKHISVGLSDKQRKGKAEHVPTERRQSLLLPPGSPHREGMVTKWHPPGLWCFPPTGGLGDAVWLLRLGWEKHRIKVWWWIAELAHPPDWLVDRTGFTLIPFCIKLLRDWQQTLLVCTWLHVRAAASSLGCQGYLPPTGCSFSFHLSFQGEQSKCQQCHHHHHTRLLPLLHPSPPRHFLRVYFVWE